MDKIMRVGLIIGIILAVLIFTTPVYSKPSHSYDFRQGHDHGHGHGHGHGDQPPSAPVAANDNGTTPENTPVTINVVANDTDAEHNLNVATVDLDVGSNGIQNSFSTPKGAYVVDNAGVVTFTPANNVSGPADVKYTVNDSTGLTSNQATIHIDITVVNAAPVANNDAAATTNNKEVQINVVANDTDSDGKIDTSKVDLNMTDAGIQKNFTSPEGTWSVNKGIVKYTPKSDFVGTATINYQVYDDDNAPSNIASISVTVTSSNIPPVAVNDAAGTTMNTAVSVNVVANDTDRDGRIDPTKVDLNTATAGVQSSASTAQGSFTVDAQGVVTYTPIALFIGRATLDYTVMDDAGAVSNAATITITVQAVNIAPIAVNDNATTTKNKAVTIKVTQNDTDADGSIDVSKVDLNPTVAGIQTTVNTAQGNYSVDNQGVVTYTPATNFTGIAGQEYIVADNAGAWSNVATINITVQNVNSPPVAADDSGATSQNTAVMVNVVSNDTDSDGNIDASKVDLDPSTGGIQASRDVTAGSFSVNNLGIVTFTPKKDFTGTASINYTVSDNSGAVSNVAKITITVQPYNAPVAVEDRATTKANTKVDINVVANDTDADGSIDATTVDLNVNVGGTQKSVTTPQGSFVVNDSGVVTFTPTTDYSGLASIQYNVKDNKGILSNAASINITITTVPNAAPVITAFEDERDTLRYTLGMAVQFTSDFEVQDSDDDSLATAEIGFVTETYSSGSDKLLFTDRGNIKGTFDAGTGALTLRGVAKIDDYVTAVRSIRYQYTGTAANLKGKTIYVRVSDGKSFSDVEKRHVKINSGTTGLDIPTAFTPNNDGANDTWQIQAPTGNSGSDFADAQIRVFDKSGVMVFDANGLGSAWDGTYQGKHLPVDTYYYTIDLKQQQKRYKGIVTILR